MRSFGSSGYLGLFYYTKGAESLHIYGLLFFSQVSVVGGRLGGLLWALMTDAWVRIPNFQHAPYDLRTKPLPTDQKLWLHKAHALLVSLCTQSLGRNPRLPGWARVAVHDSGTRCTCRA